MIKYVIYRYQGQRHRYTIFIIIIEILLLKNFTKCLYKYIIEIEMITNFASL